MSVVSKSIEGIISKFTIKKISNWLKDIIIFILKPVRFQNEFNIKSREDQVIQIGFYALINVLAYFTFGAGQSYQNSFKLVFLIAIFSIPFVLINLFSFGLVYRFKFDIWAVVRYVFISTLIFFFPILIFQYAFISTENYTFLFLSNFCLLLLKVFNFFIIHSSYHKSIFRTFLGISLNIIILNILVFALGFFIVDSFSKSESRDPIILEYNFYAKNISGVGIHPHNLIEWKNQENSIKERIFGFKKGDSLEFFALNSMKYIEDTAKVKIKYLDSIIPKLHFERNKQIFKELRLYFIEISSIENVLKDKRLVKNTIYQDSISKEIFSTSQEYLIDKIESQYIRNFNKKLEEYRDLEDYAYSPLNFLELLLYPLDFIINLFDIESVEIVTFRFS